MKILVTGGAGFIGSNFVHMYNKVSPDDDIVILDKLTYAGNIKNLGDLVSSKNITFVKGDICDKDLVDELVLGCDVIVNFAAETHVDRSIVSPEEFIRTDVFGTYVLLEAARKHAVKKFIQISTDEVYGEALHEGGSVVMDPLMPKSPYAASKAGADRLAYSYFQTYGLPVVISRCSNNYGPYQYPEKLIPLFIKNALEDKPLPVYGNGKNTRDWIFVDDHCRGICELIKRDDVVGRVFNFGSGNELCVLDIASMILEVLNKPESLINHVTDRKGHVMRHAVDVSATLDALEWRPDYDFKKCFRYTVEWYLKNRSFLNDS